MIEDPRIREILKSRTMTMDRQVEALENIVRKEIDRLLVCERDSGHMVGIGDAFEVVKRAYQDIAFLTNSSDHGRHDVCTEIAAGLYGLANKGMEPMEAIKRSKAALKAA